MHKILEIRCLWFPYTKGWTNPDLQDYKDKHFFFFKQNKFGFNDYYCFVDLNIVKNMVKGRI